MFVCTVGEAEMGLGEFRHHLCVTQRMVLRVIVEGARLGVRQAPNMVGFSAHMESINPQLLRLRPDLYFGVCTLGRCALAGKISRSTPRIVSFFPRR